MATGIIEPGEERQGGESGMDRLNALVWEQLRGERNLFIAAPIFSSSMSDALYRTWRQAKGRKLI